MLRKHKIIYLVDSENIGINNIVKGYKSVAKEIIYFGRNNIKKIDQRIDESYRFYLAYYNIKYSEINVIGDEAHLVAHSIKEYLENNKGVIGSSNNTYIVLSNNKCYDKFLRVFESKYGVVVKRLTIANWQKEKFKQHKDALIKSGVHNIGKGGDTIGIEYIDTKESIYIIEGGIKSIQSFLRRVDIRDKLMVTKIILMSENTIGDKYTKAIEERGVVVEKLCLSTNTTIFDVINLVENNMDKDLNVIFKSNNDRLLGAIDVYARSRGRKVYISKLSK